MLVTIATTYLHYVSNNCNDLYALCYQLMQQLIYIMFATNTKLIYINLGTNATVYLHYFSTFTLLRL
jgi:hypothetical protein